MKEPLHLQCACHTDAVTFTIEEDEDSYVTFLSWWQQNRPWRERIRGAWKILRGKEYYFSEVILTPENVDALREYLGQERATPNLAAANDVLNEMLGFRGWATVTAAGIEAIINAALPGSVASRYEIHNE